MADFQPPPTYAEVVLVDEQTKRATFNPIWLKWFIDLVGNLGPSGAGSVSSVGLSLPSSLFTVTGSPIIASGTLTGTLKTQVTKTFLAGPTSGADAVPTFRILATADLPAGTGTVTSVNVTPANGVSATGGPITTSGSFTFNLGAITPTSVNTGSGAITGGVFTGSSDAVIHGVTVGLGTASIATNTALGKSSLNANTTGNNNSGGGNNSLLFNQGGSSNTAFGSRALEQNISGNNNCAFGFAALVVNTASNNTAIGSSALSANTTGTSNFALGNSALNKNVGGDTNIAIGNNAIANNVSGSGNIGMGDSSLNACIGSDNIGLGKNGASSITSGSNNTAVGRSALGGVTTTNSNIGIGWLCGLGVTGTGNTIIGTATISACQNQITSGSNNISIGKDVAVASATADNQLCIGNLIYGTGLSGTGATVSSGGQITVGYSASLTIGNANRVQIAGTTAATNSLGISAWSADALGARFEGGKSRGAAINTNTIVQNNDVLFGRYDYGANGSGFTLAGSITCEVDGTPGASNDMPGRYVFKTTPDGSGTPATALTLDSAQKGTFTGALAAVGDFTVNTNKFTVTASSGNTLVAGTLSVTSDVAVNTNKLTITASSGDLVTAGTLKTANPGSGAGVWKLGQVQSGLALALNTTAYVEAMVDGAVVKLAQVL